MKKNKGITLIALIITIIVMLILVTVTILATLSENGIFNNASKATKETQAMQFYETFNNWKIAHEMDAKITNSKIEYTEEELKELGEMLTPYVNDGTITKEQKETLLAGKHINIDGEFYSINKPIEAVEIAEDVTKYYGKRVENYGSKDQIWRVFYIDKENYFGEGENTIYLKADYTKDKDGYFLDDNCWVCSEIYTTENVSETKMATLNPLWNEAKGDITRGNEAFSAYLLDPVTSENYTTTGRYWKPYFDLNNKSYINYVVGTPSVELYLRSYNDTHEDSRIEYKYNNPGGYTVKTIKDTKYVNYTSSGSLDYSGFNSMYCGRNGSKESLNDYMCCWWLSSPTPHGPGVTLQIDCQDAYIGDWYNSDKGQISPVVSLKSNFEFYLEEE